MNKLDYKNSTLAIEKSNLPIDSLVEKVLYNLFVNFTPEQLEFLASTEIIDFHSHIGDILKRNPSQIFEKGKKIPVDIRLISAYLGKYKEPSEKLKKVLKFPAIEYLVRASGKKRNNNASLETFEKSMAWVDQAVCLPIEPHQTFDDLNKAKEKEGRIIPFSSVDFTKVYNDDFLENLEKKFQKEVENGSKGLKIHPIIQGVEPNDLKVEEVVNLWHKVSNGLPIIFHTGVTEYCTKNEDCSLHKPEYGEIRYFDKLAKDCPEANIVIGHSGLMEVDDVIRLLAKYENVKVDLSFQGVNKVIELYKAFGQERVFFASDWPYGDRIPHLKVIMDVFETLKLSNTVKELILSGNAKREMKL